MSTYKPYPKYKDSGIEWLDKIPDHWTTVSLKWISNIYAGGTPDKTKPNYWDDGSIPWLNSGAVNDGLILEPSDYITENGFHNSSARWIPKQALVLALAGQGKTKGMVAQLGIETTCNQSMAAIVISKKIDPRYVYWWIATNYQNIRNMSGGDQRDGLNLELVGSIKCPQFQIDEQEAISKFLDRETSRIDILIQEQKDLIQLLKEKRQALISHAITKGLNPKVKMKDSGIEWIGQVPEHWEIKAIKWDSPVSRGASPRPIDDPKYFDENGEYAWVRISDVSESSGELTETTQKLSEHGSSLSVKLEPESLFVSIAGSVGKPCITKIKACIHDGFVYFPTLKVSPKFLFRIFESGECFGGLGKLGTQLNLNTDTIGSIKIAVPPVKEVSEILSFIELQTNKLDTLISEAESVIVLMQERRSSLISEAVTGKINVHIATATVADHKANSYFKRAVLAAEIASRMHEDFTFGRMKFQKLLYMCEHHLDFDLEGHYERYAAGPFDHKMMNSVESELQNQHWFQAVDTGKGHHYKPLPKAGAHKEYFQQYWSAQSPQFENLMKLFRPMKSEQAGIVATLYAVWNDFLIQGIQPSHEQIVTEVLTNWDDSKKKIAKKQWLKALSRMIEKQIIPHGSGRLTKKRGTTQNERANKRTLE